ncbi:hypothetical protein BGZ76_009300 [Entomortierella beljakovae]|nr:hypothetical protein BGZ76_009300 [Entomortierella beljakovae]
MNNRSLITYLLLALCVINTVCANASFKVVSPKDTDIFKVGQDITVKVEVDGGKDSEIYMKDPDVTLSIQKQIPMPDLVRIVGRIGFRDLYDNGLSFVAKKEYIIKTQKNIPYRVRASTSKFGYTDSYGFKIEA